MESPAKRRRVERGFSPHEVASNGPRTASELGTEQEPFFPSSPSAPATREDQARWRGFCEIESEPAFFNYILRNLGVKGYKVQEILGLDPELLAFVPKPIRGLIFLFRWIDEDLEDEENSCPPGVWFANQTSNYSCASIALLNIVNNIPGAELGEELEIFKEQTKGLSPALRGDQISNFDFVRNVHNTFAKKTDMLVGDFSLEDDIAQSKKQKKKKKKVVDEGEAGFHFIAFVPIEGHVWQLDGLNGQPYKLGAVEGEDWLNLVVPVIEERMGLYEDQSIQFALLGLVADPVAGLKESLAGKVLTRQKLTERLDQLDESWKQSVDIEPSSTHEFNPLSEDAHLDIHQEDVQRARLPPSVEDHISASSMKDLLGLRKETNAEVAELSTRLKEEIANKVQEDEHAKGRCYDYAPAIQAWMTMLAEKGSLQELL